MSWRLLCLLFVFPVITLGEDEIKPAVAEKIDLPCRQGSFLNKTKLARQFCQKCPENTYWALNVTYVVVNKKYQQKVNGAMCVACPIYLRSPEGSIDVTACVCPEGDSTCATSNDDLQKNNLMIIIGIIITLIAIGFLIGILFFCRMYGPGIFRVNQKSGHERLDSDEEMTNGKSSPDTNLLDIDIRLDYTEEQINDNYNDITAKGDINDMDAVLKAAIISEKRRSRCYSINSMTDLSDAGRYRTRSECEKFGNNLPLPAARNNHTKL